MKERLEKVRKENARTKRDTGSPEIQSKYRNHLGFHSRWEKRN